jgi:hypothetical protein
MEFEEPNSRQGAQSDTRKNSQLCVCDKPHRRIIVPLNPELDLTGDIFEGSGRRAGLSGGLRRRRARWDSVSVRAQHR